MGHKVLDQLCALGITKQEDVVEIFPQVRDRDDISVLCDKKSGVIFLSQSDHIDLQYYEAKEGCEYWSSSDREQAKQLVKDDDERRCAQFKELIRGKKWMDCGTGVGGVLDLLGKYASDVYAVEPQDHIRNELAKEGYKVYTSIDDCPVENIDIITLFHVVEHLIDASAAFERIYNMLAPGGKIVVEVPHAKDALITLFHLKSFKKFTFWSEHMLLHTKTSLKVFLEEAGFKNVRVEGYQRYPLANHIYWIFCGKPGGHKKWPFLRAAWLEQMYNTLLHKIDKTDTIIAYGEK